MTAMPLTHSSHPFAISDWHFAASNWCFREPQFKDVHGLARHQLTWPTPVLNKLSKAILKAHDVHGGVWKTCDWICGCHHLVFIPLRQIPTFRFDILRRWLKARLLGPRCLETRMYHPRYLQSEKSCLWRSAMNPISCEQLKECLLFW